MVIDFCAEKNKIREICIIAQNQFRDWFIAENICQEMVLAIDEALTNIFEHGYRTWKKSSEKKIKLELIRFNNKVKIIIEDKAPPYSIEEKRYSDVNTYLKSSEIGGFGVAIIKKIMNSVNLVRKNDINILELTKNIRDVPGDGSMVIETDTSEARVLDRILFVKTKPGAVIGLDEAKQNVLAYEDMVNEYPQNMVYAKIIDQKDLKYISRDAINFYIKNELSHIRAIAVVGRTAFTRSILNFLSIFSRKYRAVRLFKKNEDALKWVKKFSSQRK